MGKKIVVTGAAGWIGTNLCHHLLSQGHHVIGIDRDYKWDLPGRLSLQSHPHFTCLEHDVRSPFAADADLIYHLACPPASAEHHDLLQTAAQGTLHTLQLAEKLHIPLLFASAPLFPPSPFTQAKRAAESLCLEFLQRGVHVKIARVFNTYGPYYSPHDDRVIPSFLEAAFEGRPLTVFGDGSHTRSFLAVEDLIRGFETFLLSSQTGPLDFGHPSSISILQLAHLTQEVTESYPGIEFVSLPPDLLPYQKPKSSETQDLLGWCPKISLLEGIRRIHRETLARIV